MKELIINKIRETENKTEVLKSNTEELNKKNKYEIEKYQDEINGFMEKIYPIDIRGFCINTPDNVHIAANCHRVFQTTLFTLIFSIGKSTDYIMQISVQNEQLEIDKTVSPYKGKAKSFLLEIDAKASKKLVEKYRNAFVWFLENYENVIFELKEKERIEYLDDFKKFRNYYERDTLMNLFTHLGKMVVECYENPETFKFSLPEPVGSEDMFDDFTLEEFYEYEKKRSTEKKVEIYSEFEKIVTSHIPEIDKKISDIKNFFNEIVDDKKFSEFSNGDDKIFSYQDGDIVRKYKVNMYEKSKQLGIYLLDTNNDYMFCNFYFFLKKDIPLYATSFIRTQYSLEQIGEKEVREFTDSFRFLMENWDKFFKDFTGAYLTDYKKQLKKAEKELKEKQKEYDKAEAKYKERQQKYFDMF